MITRFSKPFITFFVLSVFIGMADTAFALGRNAIKEIVVREALNAGMKPSLALAVAKVESDFQEKALSHAGARGVMQIMPETAWGEYRLSADRLWDAETNIRTGIKFLGGLLGHYNGRLDLALSHYNGGTVKNGRPHSYTRDYIRKVLEWERRYAQQQTVWVASLPDEAEANNIHATILSYLSNQFYSDFSRQQENMFAIRMLKDELLRQKQSSVATLSIEKSRDPYSKSEESKLLLRQSKKLGAIVRWSL